VPEPDLRVSFRDSHMAAFRDEVRAVRDTSVFLRPRNQCSHLHREFYEAIVEEDCS
jgi:hypothetical protein